MTTNRSFFVVLALPLLFACGSEPEGNQPMFTTASAGTGMDTDTSMTSGTETSGDSASGDGDGDTTDTDSTDTDPATETDSTDTDSTDTDMTDSDTDMTDSDTDMTGDPGCETTDPALAGGSCGEAAGMKGAVNLGESIADLPVGTIADIDDGLGNGDWYQVQFPMDVNMRPLGGTPTISFAINDGGNYRFEVYRDCGEQPNGQGLASEFGAGAPPLTEWSFFDLTSVDEQAMYVNNVLWPSSMWIRVFRFQNEGECDTYQLQVDHLQ